MAPDPSASLIGDYAATGSAEAFAELVRRHAGLVFAVALRITGNAADAEEVSQDCFWTMSRSAAKLKPPLVPWLHRVATCRAINLVRRRNTARWRRQQYADLPAPDAEQPWRQLWPVVDEALLELPVADRGLLIRHFLEGSSQGEIAAATGVSQPTVSRRIEEALTGLRKVLARRGVATLALLTASALASLRAGEVPAALTAQLGRLSLVGAGGSAVAAAAAASKTWLVAAGLIAAALTVVAALVAIRPPAPRAMAPIAAEIATTAAPIPAVAPTVPAAVAAMPTTSTSVLPAGALPAGLRLWLRADRGVQLIAGAAAAWRDEERTLAAVAPSPLQRPRPVTLERETAALRFDGIDDVLSVPLPISGWKECAAVVVAAVREERVPPPTTQKCLWATLFWDEVSDNGGFTLCLRQGGVLAAVGTGPGSAPGRPPVGDPEVFAPHATRIGRRLHAIALLRVPGRMEIWCDGALLGRFAHDDRPIAGSEGVAHIGRGSGETWAAQPFDAGRSWHHYVGASYAPVDVAEIMVYDRTPSPSELQRLFTDIAARQHFAAPAKGEADF